MVVVTDEGVDHLLKDFNYVEPWSVGGQQGIGKKRLEF